MTEPTNGTPSPAGTGTQPEDAGRLFTQADVNAISGKVRAEASESALRKLIAEYGDLDALRAAKAKLDDLEAAQLSEADKLRKQLADVQAQQEKATAEAREATLRADRLRVGLEMGLSPVVAERLMGETVEAMKEDAQKLLDSLPASTRRVLPDTHATEGALATGSKGGVKLTAEQEEIIRRTGIDREKYVANLSK